MNHTPRGSGVLLHISSLPSPHGIGTLGKAAYAFVDFLKAAGFGIWQVLPIGPTGFGDSPYQSVSTFAGNPYFIDLDLLVRDGLLRAREVAGLARGGDGMRVDYGRVYKTRQRILRKAYKRAYRRMAGSVEAFARDNPWLPDYALFSALKDRFGGRAWSEWPDEAARMRRPGAAARYEALLGADIRFHQFVQYLFFTQWNALKAYASDNGILIFGDMPIYVAMDSADTWATPEAFLLDAERRPVCVAGVPPDYFSEDGQLWGNPLYDWEWHKKEGYGWWTRRMRAMLALFDLVRIDHFIGFANYYAVPAGAKTARDGEWRSGSGIGLFQQLARALPALPIVAEDLGAAMLKVQKLRRECGFAGMKVLGFAFASDETNPHLPHNVSADTVLYTGTHDNDTTLGWWQKAGEGERRFAADYLGLGEDGGICRALIKAAYNSAADMVIIPMQDFLELGSEARMNTPGTVGGNWQWRVLPGQLGGALADELRSLNEAYGRAKSHRRRGLAGMPSQLRGP